jgi:murein tripeptide amidase MpaA
MNRFLFLLCIFLSTSSMAQVDEWSTFYELSGKKETPRYKETMNYCHRLEMNSKWVHVTSFGKSAEGRNLPLVVIDNQGLSDPESIKASGRIVLLIQACIHPGECEGKDAGLMLIRDIMIHKKFPGLLDHVSILFIPVFNVDGHERFGSYNRINQNGPREMGWRVTAANLNLNRDFLKADAPEMQAWLKLFNTWKPDFFIDSHTTDGADYQYVLTYLMEIYGDMDPGLTDWSKNMFLKSWTAQLEKGGFPVFPYIEFRNWHDPESGIEMSVGPPMLSQVYTSLRNRPGLLLETHMLKPYDQRVSSTYEAFRATIEILGRESANLKNLIRQADNSVAGEDFRKTPFPLRFEMENDSTLVNFLGNEYKKVKSEITGDEYYQYGKTNSTFRIPCFDKNKPVSFARLPEAYIIPAEWKSVTDRLELHGIKVKRLKTNVTLTITTWKFSNPKWQSNPNEGRHPLNSFESNEISLTRNFPAGTAIVDMAQPGAKIIAHLLEPKGNGSLLYWGFFDAIFEQKEYAENYVMEPLAAKMLAEDPALKAEFEKKKSEDPAFAKNPNAILNWFFSKTPYWDNHKDIYPVGKIFDRKLVDNIDTKY